MSSASPVFIATSPSKPINLRAYSLSMYQYTRREMAGRSLFPTSTAAASKPDRITSNRFTNPNWERSQANITDSRT